MKINNVQNVSFTGATKSAKVLKELGIDLYTSRVVKNAEGKILSFDTFYKNGDRVHAEAVTSATDPTKPLGRFSLAFRVGKSKGCGMFMGDIKKPTKRGNIFRSYKEGGIF